MYIFNYNDFIKKRIKKLLLYKVLYICGHYYLISMFSEV